MNAATARKAASPYARRLARERGVALSVLNGSGPNGRIVSADIPAVTAIIPATEPIIEPAVPAAAPGLAPVRRTGAFAATIDLTALQALISAAGGGLPVDAFLIKAAGRAALAVTPVVNWAASDGSLVSIAEAAKRTPTEISRRCSEPVAGGESGALLLTVLSQTGIRPASADLPDGTPIRILIMVAKGLATAEALLVHDAIAISESAAADLLADFRDLIEKPLRLLV